MTTSLIPFARLRNELERLFGDDFYSSPTTATFWAPRVNVRETQEAVEISADLPGVSKEDLQIVVENNLLVLKGQRKEEHEDKTGTWHRIEKVYGQFERQFNLPAGLMKDQIKASLRDGILTVSIPKAEESKPRQVDIKID
ncbi:MAG: Hsp20/alpha crystallin family protein [Candidatus Sericytochromatia bacterium]|uniref:Hsp20/alpha crystallin family protein n=1 Tax=Candidatus Tanganyikabacteria bacterium TaxID=2961651 RepID=A0A938BN10_9BACT|nr:Hsp20/alpha crystallin family protein [Candidatus Tanganyikabacteria bacterium]